MLSPQQRAALLNQLIRRLGKLNDASLVQLEIVTRHPQDIQNFQVDPGNGSRAPDALSAAPEDVFSRFQPAAAEESAGGEPLEAQPAQAQEPPAPVGPESAPAEEDPARTAPVLPQLITRARTSLSGQKLNRRQAIVYGLTGLASLVTLAGVIYTVDRQKESGANLLTLREEIDQLRERIGKIEENDLDAALREAMDSMLSRIADLEKQSDETLTLKTEAAGIMKALNTEKMEKAIASLSELKNVTANMQSLNNAPYHQEALDNLLAMIETRDIKYFFEFLKAYKEQIPGISAYIRAIPQFFQANQDVSESVTPWLTDEMNFVTQLIEPLQNDLFPAVDELDRQVTSVASFYRITLVEAVTALIEDRESLYQQINEL